MEYFIYDGIFVLMDKSIHNQSYKEMIALLRLKRVQNNITQEQLAKDLGVKQALISKIETCERRIDVLELKTICKCIGVDFLEFIKIIDNL